MLGFCSFCPCTKELHLTADLLVLISTNQLDNDPFPFKLCCNNKASKLFGTFWTFLEQTFLLQFKIVTSLGKKVGREICSVGHNQCDQMLE